MQAEDTQTQIKDLQQAITKDDSTLIYNLAHSLLNQNPDDSDYRQCFVIAALKLNRFDELSSGLFKEKPTDNKL